MTTVVAVSPAMRELLAGRRRAWPRRTSPVLLEGESGTGKDLLAHWLHYKGPRRDGPFIKVHCPSIPEDLLESELFGHERGAFTDARQAKAGKIELAAGRHAVLRPDRGPEPGPAGQAPARGGGAPLRAAGRHAHPRGGRALRVRLRPSTCGEAVASGTFREDLYHRLSVVPLTLPPLRERREDILPLAELFLARERERARHGRAHASRPRPPRPCAATPGRATCASCASVVERAALVQRGGGRSRPPRCPPTSASSPRRSGSARDRRPSLQDVEQAYIRYVLEQVAGTQTRAAAILGISRKALWEKRRRYGIP